MDDRPTRREAEAAMAAAGMDPASRHVLVTMMLPAAGPDGRIGEVYSSWARIVEATGLSRSTVARRVRRLVMDGWLVASGSRAGRTGRIRRYRVRIPDVVANSVSVTPSNSVSVTPLEPNSVRVTLFNSVSVTPRRTRELRTNKKSPAEPDRSCPDTGQLALVPTPDSQPPDSPYRTAGERAAWDACVGLWQATVSGTLRPHRRIDPARGAGRDLLRAIRAVGGTACLQVVLWMTSAAESAYLRDSEMPRGMQTIYNQRARYPELAEEWLASDPMARTLAARHGVPHSEPSEAPVSRPTAPPYPDPSEDRAAAAQAAWRRRMGLTPLPHGPDDDA